MDVFMRESDAFSWYMERDPVLRSTVVAVAWVDHAPDWDLLSAKVDQATRLVPLFRKRVTEPPGRLAAPRWTVDDQFDLKWHLCRIDAPPPHTPQTVLEFARNEAMTAFDHARPLWKFTLVEHLEGDRAALVMKIHHSLTDGLGGIEMALLLFDTEPGAPAPTVLAEAPAPEQVDTPEIVRESIARDWSRVAGFLTDRARTALPFTLRAARHPVTSLGRAIDISRSIWRTVAPASETLSPVMKSRGLGRHLEMVEFGLADLRRAAATAGGTVNDGFVASVTGGLRRYHERKGYPVETLRVTLPISIRRQDDPVGGNRITLIRLAVPVSEADPARRIPDIHELCCAARHELSLAYTDAIAGTLNLLPAGVLGSMLKHVDFVASDVPGFTFPVYLAGALLERYVAFGPTIGAGVNETLLSYNGRCCVGVTVDTAAVDDRDLFVESLREGLEEVLVLGGDHEPVLLPLLSPTVPAG